MALVLFQADLPFLLLRVQLWLVVSPSPPAPIGWCLVPRCTQGKGGLAPEPALCSFIPLGTPGLLPSGNLAEQLQETALPALREGHPGGSIAGSDPGGSLSETCGAKRWEG